jgi:hypothetical protein
MAMIRIGGPVGSLPGYEPSPFRPRLIELGVVAALERFVAKRPPPDVYAQAEALLDRLIAAIETNLGNPPSHWELERAVALKNFIEPPPEPTKTLPKKGKARQTKTKASYAEVRGWYTRVYANGAANRDDADAAVDRLASEAGCTIATKLRLQARKGLGSKGGRPKISDK